MPYLNSYFSLLAGIKMPPLAISLKAQTGINANIVFFITTFHSKYISIVNIYTLHMCILKQAPLQDYMSVKSSKTFIWCSDLVSFWPTVIENQCVNPHESSIYRSWLILWLLKDLIKHSNKPYCSSQMCISPLSGGQLMHPRKKWKEIMLFMVSVNSNKCCMSFCTDLTLTALNYKYRLHIYIYTFALLLAQYIKYNQKVFWN